MMVRLLRSNKWELIMIVMGSSLLSTAIWFAGVFFEGAALPPAEWWPAVAAVFALANIGVGYWAAQRMQRRIDQLRSEERRVGKKCRL